MSSGYKKDHVCVTCGEPCYSKQCNSCKNKKHPTSMVSRRWNRYHKDE
jgi:hypothetical protein